MAVRIGGPDLLTALNGVPTILGIIIATTTKNNHDTATPFNNVAADGPTLSGKTIMIQPDTACYIRIGALNTQTATAADGTGGSYYMAARQTLVVVMGEQSNYLACVAAAGTTNLKVWELN